MDLACVCRKNTNRQIWSYLLLLIIFFGRFLDLSFLKKLTKYLILRFFVCQSCYSLWHTSSMLEISFDLFQFYDELVIDGIVRTQYFLKSFFSWFGVFCKHNTENRMFVFTDSRKSNSQHSEYIIQNKKMEDYLSFSLDLCTVCFLKIGSYFLISILEFLVLLIVVT